MIRPFNWGQIWSSIAAAVQFIPQTLILSLAPFAIALMLGTLVAIARIWKVPVLSQLFAVVVTVLKGIPTYLLLVAASLISTLYYRQIAAAFGLKAGQDGINGIVLGVIVLSFAAVPTVSESIRGAMLTVSSDQSEAGYAAGLTRGQIMRRIIIPQTIPEAIPILTNNLVSMVKASALCSLVGVSEVLSASIRAADERYDLLEGYIAAALVYWVLCFVLEQGMNKLAYETSRFKFAIVA